MNPGLNQILGVVCSADVAEIENVTTIESVDVSCHHSKDTWIEVGYGLPVDDPSIPGKLEKYTRVFADSVLMMADCFDLKLDEVKFSYELGACTKDVDLGWYTLPKGSLGGNYIKYQGMVDGVPRVETHLEWQMTPHTDPSWDIKGCYITQIKGDPCIYNKHMIFPKPGVDLSNPDNFASIGMTVTGHARAERDQVGGRRAAGTGHQRRSAAARVRRPLQAVTRSSDAEFEAFEAPHEQARQPSAGVGRLEMCDVRSRSRRSRSWPPSGRVRRRRRSARPCRS